MASRPEDLGSVWFSGSVSIWKSIKATLHSRWLDLASARSLRIRYSPQILCQKYQKLPTPDVTHSIRTRPRCQQSSGKKASWSARSTTCDPKVSGWVGVLQHSASSAYAVDTTEKAATLLMSPGHVPLRGWGGARGVNMRNDDWRGSRCFRTAEDNSNRPGATMAVSAAYAVEAVQYAGKDFRGERHVWLIHPHVLCVHDVSSVCASCRSWPRELATN